MKMANSKKMTRSALSLMSSTAVGMGLAGPVYLVRLVSNICYLFVCQFA